MGESSGSAGETGLSRPCSRGARSCTTGAALFQRTGRCTAGTATCDDSFNVKIPLSGDGRSDKFLP